MPRRSLLIAVAALIVVVAVVGLLQSGGAGDSGSREVLSARQVRAGVTGAPARLAAVHRQANELLDGERGALQRRLESLRGYPVVVNVWGSWCTPCRDEMPIFQRVSVRQARRVAFLGIATLDARASAARFLRDVPVPYPSYLDPDGSIAKRLGLLGTPSTIFYDARGRAFLHQGRYTSEADLEADIRRHAT